MSNDGFSVADIKKLAGDKVSGHQFKAEINQLMSLIVNSLYSNRDIFIRELISNSADALDKIRYISLTDPSQLSVNPTLQVQIKIDSENKLIHIRDTGVGMTQKELIANLGSIAKSGTKEFLKKMETGASDVSQIGQFGVGFYSAFLVADKVTVTSKHNSDDQYIWESTMDADAAFSVAKDPRGNTLGRGTMVTLHLKDDAKEYLEHSRLVELVKHYNEFITFPVSIWESRQEEIPVEETEKPAEEKKPEKDIVETEEEIEDEDETETVAEPKKTKTVWGWRQINSVQPIWTREKSSVTKEEYNKFYTETLHDSTEPILHTHFRAEGDVEFTALLYVPTTAPQSTELGKNGVKLYVKRVFISDKFDNLLPQWLSFIRGVVDSDDLPLNVSREILQKNKILQNIQRKLIRKVISTLQDLADDETDVATWNKFYSTYSQYLKVGAIRDTGNRARISKLLRWNSAKSEDKTIGFEEYVKNMKEGQKDIYYLGGENKEMLMNSPLLERLVKLGYDVLLFTEPIDEYLATNIQKYDSHNLVDISKEGLKLDDDDKEAFQAYSEEFKPLTTYLTDLLSKEVSSVVVSMRLSTSPSALVSAQWGYSANMERILKAQALGEKGADATRNLMMGRKVLEINPRHPIIKQLLVTVQAGAQNDETSNAAMLLFDSASISSGSSFKDPSSVVKRLNKIISQSLGVDPLATADEEVFAEKVEKKEKTNDEL